MLITLHPLNAMHANLQKKQTWSLFVVGFMTTYFSLLMYKHSALKKLKTHQAVLDKCDEIETSLKKITRLLDDEKQEDG